MLETLESILSDILERLDAIERSMSERAEARPVDRMWLSLDEAALIAGRSKAAVRSLLRRERERPDGMAVRRMHGVVHREDFLALMERRAEEGSLRVARARRSVDDILKRRD